MRGDLVIPIEERLARLERSNRWQLAGIVALVAIHAPELSPLLGLAGRGFAVVLNVIGHLP